MSINLPVNADDHALRDWLTELSERAFRKGVWAGLFYGSVGTFLACVWFLP